MKKKSLKGAYDPFSKLLHWILALLLPSLILLGWFMIYIEDRPGSGWYFNLHKSVGISVGGLILLRILWRFLHKPAPLPTSIPLFQAKISRLVHFMLYFCMIAMPITGFIGASYGSHGLMFYGLKLPKFLSANHALAEKFFQIHGVVAWVLVTLLVLHLLAAFKHLLVNKDGVFQRMWF